MVRPNLAHVVDELYNYFHLGIRKTVQNRQNLLGHSVHNYLVDRSHPYFEKNVRKMFAVFGSLYQEFHFSSTLYNLQEWISCGTIVRILYHRLTTWWRLVTTWWRQIELPNYDTCNLMWYCDLIFFRFLGDVLRSYYSDKFMIMNGQEP